MARLGEECRSTCDDVKFFCWTVYTNVQHLLYCLLSTNYSLKLGKSRTHTFVGLFFWIFTWLICFHLFILILFFVRNEFYFFRSIHLFDVPTSGTSLTRTAIQATACGSSCNTTYNFSLEKQKIVLMIIRYGKIYWVIVIQEDSSKEEKMGISQQK